MPGRWWRGGLAGLPLGILLLPLIDAGTLTFAVGVLLCVYCPAMLAFRRLPQVRWGGRWADAAVGVVGGVLGGVAGLSGPAPTLWCTLRGWERDAQRAVFQTFLIVIQGVGIVGLAIAGLLTAEVLRLAAWLLPVIVLPALLGSRLYARLDADLFRRLVLALLLVTGVVLVARSF